MADVTVKTVTTDYDKSIKRSVDGTLELIAYTKTPFYTSIRKGKCTTNGLVERMEDNLAAVKVNAAVEGADVATLTVVAPGTIDNRVQRFEESFRVSKDMEKVEKHARKSEIDRIQGNKMKEIARDMESAMLNSTRVTGTDTVAAKMDGALAFCPTANTYSFDDAFADSNHITEDILLDVMQAMYADGAEPDTVLAPLAQKRKISAFTDKGRVTINADAGSKKLTMAVNILETDFGTVAVMPTIFINSVTDTAKEYDTCLIYDSTKIECKTFRELEREELAKTGDARKFYLTCSKTILPDSKKVVGKITNLTRVKVA